MDSFEFRVPIRVDDTFARRPPRQTVLVVTADDALREAAARVVMSAGYRVVTAAHSGHAVLACLTEGPIDVVAVDLAMDDTSGPALAERLRRHQPALLSMYFAARGTPASDGVLVRPFTSDDLVERIEALVALV